MNVSNVGPFGGASQTVGGSTLPSAPTFRQIFMKSGTGAGLYVCTSDGSWTLLEAASGAGDVVGPAASTNLGLARFDGTTGKLLKNSLTTLSDAGVFTFVSNKRQTFVPGAQQSGFNVGSVSTDPSIPINGDLWYNTGSFQLKAQINGSTVVLGAGITNSASVNVLMKSDGTNAVASRLTDNGTDIIVNSGTGSTTIGDTSAVGNSLIIAVDNAGSTISIDSKGGRTTIGDKFGVANEVRLVVDDAGGEVRIDNAPLNIGGNIFPVNAGSFSVGTVSNPIGSVIIGGAVNTSSQLVSTATTNQVITFPDATGTVQLVGAAGTGQFVPLPVNNTVLATATGTVFTSPGNNGTALSATSETTVSWPIVVGSSGKTIRNLIVQTGTTAKVNTPVTVITIRVDGVATAVTVTMTQTVTTITADTTHTAALAAGNHLITVSLATTGTAAVSTSIAGISFEID